MRIAIVNTAAAVLFAAICYPCVMTNAQDCETEREILNTQVNTGINSFVSCSVVLSRVVTSVISRQPPVTQRIRTSDLNLVCRTTSSNATDVCQSRVMNYFTACRSIEAVSEEEQAISYGCTIDPISGSYCANRFSLPINIGTRDNFRFLPPLRDVFSSCVRDYFDGICSRFQCNDFLQRYAQPAGCCYNEALKAFFSNSTSFTEDEYEIAANNYFTLCNLTNPGFCMNTPTSSCSLSLTELFQNNNARECREAIQSLRFQILDNHVGILSLANISGCLEQYLAYLENCNDFTITSSQRDSERACLSSAITMFGQNNTCGNTATSLLRTVRTSFSSFRTFEDILEVQNASEIMCSIPECPESLTNYINSCDIQSNLTDLLCYGQNGRSCLALQQSGVLNTLASSYEQYGSQCFATVISSCTSACREIVTAARDNAGCCAYEYLRFLIIDNDLTHFYSADQLFEACSISGGRCGLVTDASSTVIAHSLSVGIFIIMSILSTM